MLKHDDVKGMLARGDIRSSELLRIALSRVRQRRAKTGQELMNLLATTASSLQTSLFTSLLQPLQPPIFAR